MKGLVQMLLESKFYNRVPTEKECISKLKGNPYIKYVGINIDDVAEAFETYYKVRPIYAAKEEVLIIPCNKEMEYDLKDEEDGMFDTFLGLGYSPDLFIY